MVNVTVMMLIMMMSIEASRKLRNGSSRVAHDIKKLLRKAVEGMRQKPGSTGSMYSSRNFCRCIGGREGERGRESRH